MQSRYSFEAGMPLKDFLPALSRIGKDPTLFATHMSLFCRFIYLLATYHKCLRELSEGELVGYRPGCYPRHNGPVWKPEHPADRVPDAPAVAVHC